MIHLVIVQVTSGKVDITVEFVYILLINSLIVEVILLIQLVLKNLIQVTVLLVEKLLDII